MMTGFGTRIWIALAVTLTALPATSEAGRFVTHEFRSNALAGNPMAISSTRRITVHVPDGYDRERGRYPVVYYLPGFGDSGIVAALVERGLGDALDKANRRPALTVLIDLNEEIVALNSQEFGRWADFLIEELIPFIDKTYRTIPAPEARVLIGFSMGGLSAVVLSAQHPGVWGSVGLNEGSAYLAGYYEMHVGREGQLPAALQGDFQKVLSAWKNMPRSLEGYSSWQGLVRILVQLGLVISPNPASPLRFDPPIDREGNPVASVIEKWREYSPFDPATIARNRPALAKLSRIALVVPNFDGATTNAYQNVYWMSLMAAAGIPVIRIDMPGDHSDFQVERLVALQEALLEPNRQ